LEGLATVVPFLSALIYFLLLITSVFLVCLVLIQRGKGGGLVGAFGGGAGGGSAFGSKAGDVFTRVTMITAGIWIALNMVLVILSNQRTSAWGDTPTPGSASKSTFSANPEKKDGTGKPAGLPPSTAPSGAASPFDALSPPNPNSVAPSPLGNGPTPEIKSELPSPFPTESATPATPSPLPVGSTPSGGGNAPKP